MTTAEKRAALETQGEPWPTCECHNTEMAWQRNTRLPAGGRFLCRIYKEEWRRAYRAKRRANGLCVDCGAPAATDTMCRSCADRHAATMAQPKQKLLHQLAVLRHRARERAGEGFQPTGAGLAAFAAYKQATGEQ